MTDADALAGGAIRLTEREIEALDLLVQHKTSKEIAAALAVSPKAIDERIASARVKLGCSDRRELAVTYQRLRAAPVEQRLLQQSSQLPQATEPQQSAEQEPESSVYSLSDATTFQRSLPWEQAEPAVLPEVFHGPDGTRARLNAILEIAMKLFVVGLLGYGAALALTQMMRAG